MCFEKAYIVGLSNKKMEQTIAWEHDGANQLHGNET